MSLDVDPPEPPDLTTPEKSVADYDDAEVANPDASLRRDDLDSFLRDGAWTRGFNEWAEHTDLSEDEYAVARDLGLFREFDFFWDDAVGRVGYHSPGVPETWRERDLHPDLDSWATASTINASLAELGDTVAELLTDEYVDWDADPDVPDDLPDFDA
jgi:hypothetical protein